MAPSEADSSSAAATSDQEYERTMAKISRKTCQLRSTGTTSDDHENLKDRLKFVWDESSGSEGATNVTKWRKATARKAYTDIQDASNHLFLAVLLAISPTECTKPSFKRVRDSLVALKTYSDYELNIDAAEKRFFDSTATEQGFSGNDRYLSFINSLFPQEDRGSHLRTYSGIPLDKINRLFEILRTGVETGSGWQEERARGDSAASFVVAMVPADDKDICFQITVGRSRGMEALDECKLTQLNP